MHIHLVYIPFTSYLKNCNFTLYVFLRTCLLFMLFYSLDTFPYAGTTTTCESLYMGVPCVTMGGSVHANNVGVSLLNTVGMEVYYTCLITTSN